MHTETFGEYIRQLREAEEMPLRKLAAALDIDQSTLSKLERGERPVTRQMIPIIAKIFKQDEKELTIKYMSENIAIQLQGEKFASDILKATEKELDSKTKSKK
jgi:transcriptional regulator with XRE-family HTH domain